MSLDSNFYGKSWLYDRSILSYRFKGERISTFEHSGIWITTSETLCTSSTHLQREGKLFTGPVIPIDIQLHIAAYIRDYIRDYKPISTQIRFEQLNSRSRFRCLSQNLITCARHGTFIEGKMQAFRRRQPYEVD